ncbi:hypothetical protein METY_1286 [Methylopila sp. Yamaguchi]|nr:hypothetical protein METY_1286 [Methylopila sp. Yamaguchi]
MIIRRCDDPKLGGLSEPSRTISKSFARFARQLEIGIMAKLALDFFPLASAVDDPWSYAAFLTLLVLSLLRSNGPTPKE